MAENVKGLGASLRNQRLELPFGVLEKVNALIDTYRQEAKANDHEDGALLAKLQSLKTGQENKQPAMVSEPEPVKAEPKPKTNTQRKYEQRQAKKRKKRR